MTDRRLAIVGGHGFIGAELVRHANERGWQTLVIDPSGPREGDGRSDSLSVTASILDEAALTAALGDFHATAVVNLAAYGLGAEGLASGARTHPGAAVDVNIRGNVNLLSALDAVGCRTLVWSSSSTVYGPGSTAIEPVTEADPVVPDLVYGATKVGAEHVTRVVSSALAIRSVALRLPLIYGGGRWYGGSQRDLVSFVADLAEANPAAHLRAWTTPADWMHVSDAAACLLALAEPSAQADAPVYNVTGHRSSLFDLGVELIGIAGMGQVSPVDGGPGVPLMDTSRIERDLPEFRPEIDSADAGARRYLTEARHDVNTEEKHR